MSMNALAIDVMLPALSELGADLGVAAPNHRQWVVVAFAMGMGFGQLFFGPLSDRFGRRRVLLASLAAYALFGAACTVAPGFRELVAFRALQGVASSGARVTAVAVVRDTHAGRAMARTMAFVMMTFMAVPILAPALGQAVLWLTGAWRAIFGLLVAFAGVMAGWSALRLPETLPAPRRRPIDPRSLAAAYREVLGHRTTRGYILALGLMFGALMGFLGASEQLFQSFGREATFVYWFAGIAGAMAVSNFVSARLVQGLGPRRVGHAALGAFVGVQLAWIGALALGATGFGAFYAAMVGSFFCLSLIGANFNAIALEPMGHLAGTASAALGFASTTLAAIFGGAIGQRFDGTPWPFAVGFLTLGLAASAAVLHAERAPR
jgi:DHA1 family bicyclomycin/chloramphenicol resistance-like MFS transporter